MNIRIPVCYSGLVIVRIKATIQMKSHINIKEAILTLNLTTYNISDLFLTF